MGLIETKQENKGGVWGKTVYKLTWDKVKSYGDNSTKEVTITDDPEPGVENQPTGTTEPGVEKPHTDNPPTVFQPTELKDIGEPKDIKEPKGIRKEKNTKKEKPDTGLDDKEERLRQRIGGVQLGWVKQCAECRKMKLEKRIPFVDYLEYLFQWREPTRQGGTRNRAFKNLQQLTACASMFNKASLRHCKKAYEMVTENATVGIKWAFDELKESDKAYHPTGGATLS